MKLVLKYSSAKNKLAVWIPCNERLPEPEIAVLFTNENGQVGIGIDRVNNIYGKDWKPQTVSTFFSKLVRKNYVKMQRNGKIYTYKPLISEADYNREQLKRIYSFLYRNDKHTIIQDLENL